MKNVFLLLLMSIGLLFSCTKNDSEPKQNDESVLASDYSKLTISELMSDSYSIDLEKSHDYLLKIYQSKSENNGILTKENLEMLGNPRHNYELLYALIVSENYRQDQLISNEEVEAINKREELEVETRSSRVYKWDGVGHYYSFFWRTNYYLCHEYVNFVGSCSGYSNRKIWRACGKINCNIPQCYF